MWLALAPLPPSPGSTFISAVAILLMVFAPLALLLAIPSARSLAVRLAAAAVSVGAGRRSRYRNFFYGPEAVEEAENGGEEVSVPAWSSLTLEDPNAFALDVFGDVEECDVVSDEAPK